MRIINTIFIRGDNDSIYQLAANIRNWPRLLPHYRYVRIEEESDAHRIAWMGASRDGFPVRWKCRQELYPDERRIVFEHIGGITKGMYVEWRLVEEAESVRVTISHELHYPTPIFGPLFANLAVGRLFVHNIAGKTLRCIKEMVESEASERTSAAS